MRNRAVGFLLSIAVIMVFTQFVDAQERRVRRQSRWVEFLKIDGERIKSYVAWLSREELQGRKSGSEGYQAAADWVAAQYRAWGVSPAGVDGTYFQEGTFRGYTLTEGAPAMNIGGRKFHLPDGQFSLNGASTTGTSVNADIVFVGYGISAPDKGLDEYESVDVQGKVVLILTGNPKNAPPAGGGRFTSGESTIPDLEADFTNESRLNAKLKTAFDKGAAGALLFQPAEQSAPGAGARGQVGQRAGARGRGGQRAGLRGRGGQRRGGARGGGASFTPERAFLAFNIQAPVFQEIMRENEQETNNGLTRRLGIVQREINRGIVHSFDTGKCAFLKGYDAIHVYSEENDNLTARNVIAKIEGTDPQLKDEVVMVGGHLDHLGVRDGVVYNGADDDASGSAVTMEVARILVEAGFQPKRTIVFCCWFGEEMGTLGSRHYANNPCDGVTMDKVVAYLNMDMVGLGDVLTAPGALDYPFIWEVMKKNQDEDILARVQPTETTRLSSDHAAYVRMGIPGMALQTREGIGHLDYHQPEDDIEKIQPEALRLTGQFVMQAAINLANETGRAMILPNRLELYQSKSVTVANFNPQLPDSTWTYAELETGEDMQSVIMAKAMAMLDNAESKPRKSVAVGLKGEQLDAFDGDMNLCGAAMELLGVGRVEVGAGDSFLVANRRLSEAGREALAALEEDAITLHFVSPPRRLLGDVLEAATRPFIVTGSYAIRERMVDQLNEKNILLGVDFDPGDVETCAERLAELKETLGDADNLIVFLTSSEELGDAPARLHQALKEAGFTDEEISGRNSGVMGGNLNILR